jgi:hypothetical protein
MAKFHFQVSTLSQSFPNFIFKSNPLKDIISIPETSADEINEVQSSPPGSFPLRVIPCRIAAQIQLPIRGSALDLGQMIVRPAELCNKSCCEPVVLVDVAPSREEEEIVRILQQIPCPSTQNLDRIQLKWADSGRANFQAVEVGHSGVKTVLPAWVLGYWKSVAMYWTDIVCWRRAYMTLNAEIDCPEMVDLLSSIPWQQHRSPIPGATISDLALFSTTGWASDNHINIVGWFVNARLKSDAVRVLQAGYADKLRYSFMSSNSTPAPMRSTCRWLDLLRNDLHNGKYDAVGFPVHVVAGEGLPTRPEHGNHWVAVVIDARASIIWYGDSLGDNPHRSVVEMVRWWLKPAFQNEFSLRLLKYNTQSTSWSCGDRAMNMIAHHFEPATFPLIGRRKEDAIHNRFNLLFLVVDMIRRVVSILNSVYFSSDIELFQPGSRFFIE